MERLDATVEGDYDYFRNSCRVHVRWVNKHGNQCGTVIEVSADNAPRVLPKPQPIVTKTEPTSYLKPEDQRWVQKQLELSHGAV